MNTLKYIKNIVVIVLAVLLVNSCKIETPEPMGDAGQTLVKLNPSGFYAVGLNAVSTSQLSPMFEIRRDCQSEAALNSTTTVILQKDDAILTAYNTANGTTFIPLPATLGTTTPAAGSDGKVTMIFNASEFAKSLVVTVPDATKFDFTKAYALAYKLSSVSGTGAISKGSDLEIVVQVMIKNKYDGIYEANGTMVDLTNATLLGYYPFKYKLVTAGANSCECIEFDNDYPLHPISSAGAWSYYGSFGLIISFDASGSGVISNLVNYFGVPANTRTAALDPTGVNKWDPATKKIQIKYFMKQPSVVTTAPNIRTTFDETWTYKAVR